MDLHNNNINDTEYMHGTSLTMILFQNIKYLLVLTFYPLMDWLIAVVPDWKISLENFKLVGGAVIVVLVITKLIIEIFKLTKK